MGRQGRGAYRQSVNVRQVRDVVVTARGRRVGRRKDDLLFRGGMHALLCHYWRTRRRPVITRCYAQTQGEEYSDDDDGLHGFLHMHNTSQAY